MAIQIHQLSKGDVVLVTNGPKRVALVTETGSTYKDIEVGEGRAPVRQEFQKVVVKVCSPAIPIRGKVTPEEADVNRAHRMKCLDDYRYDLWDELWVDATRERVQLDGRPKVVDKDWIHFIKVEQVTGRHGAHEGQGKSGTINGMSVECEIIPPEDVPLGLFDPIDKDEMTQAQKEEERKRQEIINEYKMEQIAKEKAGKQGDPRENAQWGPWPILKAQAEVLGVDLPLPGSEGKMKALRYALAPELIVLGINPWDVAKMAGDEFRDLVEEKRSSVSLT